MTRLLDSVVEEKNIYSKQQSKSEFVKEHLGKFAILAFHRTEEVFRVRAKPLVSVI